MKHTQSAFPSPTGAEFRSGSFYLCFQLLLLPSLLSLLSGLLPRGLTGPQLNFTFYGINFLAAIWIFHSFLGKNGTTVRAHPIRFFQSAVLGLAGYLVLYFAVTWLIREIAPDFANANDSAMNQLARSDFYLTAVGVVVLVPLAEECFHRGLIFRGLWGKSRALAYCVSTAVFAAIHIVGYLGIYGPRGIFLSFLQYVPAGLCLAWTYQHAGSIYASILVHSCVNLLALFTTR